MILNLRKRVFYVFLALGISISSLTVYANENEGIKKAYEEPIYDEEKLKDDTIEFSEIAILVEKYSLPAITEDIMISSSSRSLDELRDNLMTIYNESKTGFDISISELKADKKDSDNKDEKNAIDRAIRENKKYRRKTLKNIEERIDDIDDLKENIRDSVADMKMYQAKDMIEKALESTFFAYWRLDSRKNILSMQEEYLEKLYNLDKKKYDLNIISDLKLKEDEINLSNVKLGIEKIDNSMKQIKRSIALSLSWTVEDAENIKLGNLPSFAYDYPMKRNRQEDKEIALSSNFLYGNALRSKMGNYFHNSKRDKDLFFTEENLYMNMDNLFSDMENALITYKDTESRKESLNIKKEKFKRMHDMGMISDTEYLGALVGIIAETENIFISELSYKEAVFKYEWSLRGIV